jgi:hypothetical protein
VEHTVFSIDDDANAGAIISEEDAGLFGQFLNEQK